MGWRDDILEKLQERDANGAMNALMIRSCK